MLGLALLLQVTPDGQGVTLFGWRLPESCLVKATTGGSCPGCGLTRSFVSGARLDPAAFRFHPLGPLLLLALVLQIPYRAYRIWGRRRAGGADLPSARVPSPWRAMGVIAALILLFVGVWGARQAGVIP